LVEADYESSYDYARQAEQLLAHHVNLLYAQAYAATASAALGDFRGARLRVKRVLPQAVNYDEQVLTCLVLPVTAVVLAHDGQHKRAAEVVTLALHHRASLGKWAEGVLSHFQLLSAPVKHVARPRSSASSAVLDVTDVVDYFASLKKIVPYRDS
jgi:ATP/maltotriose-dependent transcriptional regulator MalT